MRNERAVIHKSTGEGYTRARVQRVHPVHGYDLDRVSAVHCLTCDQPIGEEAFQEITTLARFGQMLFAHEQCAVSSNDPGSGIAKNTDVGSASAASSIATNSDGGLDV